MPQLEIDDIDFKIAQELKDNARISYKLLGDKISLSVSPVYTRVKKMEENGIIKNIKQRSTGENLDMQYTPSFS